MVPDCKGFTVTRVSNGFLLSIEQPQQPPSENGMPTAYNPPVQEVYTDIEALKTKVCQLIG